MSSSSSYNAANRLDGKTILITGASSGIGRSVAFEFARSWPQNLRLILTARRVERLESIAEEIVKEFGNGIKILPVGLDVSNRDQIRAFIDRLPREWRNINVLVNNA
jgi:3-hydroxy acid dehydrogenase/malonic semialdehyde reductase